MARYSLVESGVKHQSNEQASLKIEFHCWWEFLYAMLQVHKQNSTKLGELVRDSYKGRCDPLLLKRVSALTVLVEVGVDKLFRDYVHAFLGYKIFNARVGSFVVTP